MFDNRVYQKTHYDTIAASFPKTEGAQIKAAARAGGITVSELVRRSIGQYLGMEFRMGNDCDVSLDNYYKNLTGEDLSYAG